MADTIMDLYNKNTKNKKKNESVYNFNSIKKHAHEKFGIFKKKKKKKIDTLKTLDDLSENEEPKNENFLETAKHLSKIYYGNKFEPKKKVNFNSANHDPSQVKKVLCFNILNRLDCPYENDCIYAHNLSEQNIEKIREEAYNIIRGDFNLSGLDLVNNKHLTKNLIALTKLCNGCCTGSCPGGYNCKYGVFSKSNQICYDDMIKGKCKYKNKCDKMHLTKRGLIPFEMQKGLISEKKINSFMNEKRKKKENKIFYQAKRKINQGIILDDEYLSKKMGQDLSTSSDTVSDEEIKTMKNLLNGSDEEFDMDKNNVELDQEDLEILKLDLDLEN